MEFGDLARELRHLKKLSPRRLSFLIGLGFTYHSRVENEQLNYGDDPGEALISRPTEADAAHEEELLILAKRIPEWVREIILERPHALLKITA